MRNKDTDLYEVVNNMKSLKLEIQDKKAIERNCIQGKAKASYETVQAEMPWK